MSNSMSNSMSDSMSDSSCSSSQPPRERSYTRYVLMISGT
jgi:hypothetical protein